MQIYPSFVFDDFKNKGAYLFGMSNKNGAFSAISCLFYFSLYVFFGCIFINKNELIF